MRTINLIVIHCSATREDKDFTEYDLDVCHRQHGFNGAGYHFYIRKNGDIKSTRPIEKVGAHAKGFNGGLVSAMKAGSTAKVAQRYPDRMAETFTAGTGSYFTERLSGMPRMRSP